ncbi:MAG: GNAT family acetyltransferase [Verrucomicrobiota bacterium]
MVIRRFHQDDTQNVISLWRECDLVFRLNDPKSDIDTKIDHSADDFLVAIKDETLVGSVMAGYEGHRGWINYLAVAPAHRNQGIARTLMKAAEESLRAQGCPKINLQIRIHNQQAIEFYKTLGFSIDATISMGKRIDGKS